MRDREKKIAYVHVSTIIRFHSDREPLWEMIIINFIMKNNKQTNNKHTRFSFLKLRHEEVEEEKERKIHRMNDEKWWYWRC